jgi:glutamate 5-kinase
MTGSVRPSLNNSPFSDRSSAGEGEGDRRREPRESPLLVLKVGTSSLIVSDSSGQRVQLANVAQLVDLIAMLRRRGYQVVLVTSGAVGMGCIKLGLDRKPRNPRTKQAVAAAGQSQLMRMYEDLFGAVRIQVAQILLNQGDFLDQEHWATVRGTILECLNLGVVPIINENDSTNSAELRFGDNDNLAALTAVQLEAHGLFLFTDVDFLYTANPRADPTAKPLRIVQEPWALQVDTSEAGSDLGTGGMATKIHAARMASTAGIPCGLINGQHPLRLLSFLEYGVGAAAGQGPDTRGAVGGERPLPHGTYFMAMASEGSIGETRRWIMSLPATAELHMDDGSARALAEKQSLLPVGIHKVQGSFERYDCVKLTHRGEEIGRALVNFGTEELATIRGCKSGDFEEKLGYPACAEACHRGNVVLTVDPKSLLARERPTMSQHGYLSRRGTL